MATNAPQMALLTPSGRGAVAVMRVWGPGSLTAVDAAFRPMRGGPLAETPPRRPRFGRLGAGRGDEVVVIILDGEPGGVEVQCHGGSAAIDLVVQGLEEQGVRLASASAFLQATAPTATTAEAWEDLARATTLRTAEILLEQAQGALDRDIEAITADGPIRTSHLDTLIHRGKVGVRLVDGWRVAISGRPNAGKSRLLNALAGYARAIVAPTPGTTRDAVTVRTAFDGWPVELVDTAGVRRAEDAVERIGVERALRERARADLTLLVLDRSRPLEPGDEAPLGTTVLVVASKADLPAAWDPAKVFGPSAIVVSAESGTGLDVLGTAIVRALVPEPPPAGVGVPFRRSQMDRLILMRSATA